MCTTSIYEARNNFSNLVALAESGENGFGYDCMFCPDEYEGKTFAEISAEEKNLISHRGRALEKFTEKIKEMQGEKQ